MMMNKKEVQNVSFAIHVLVLFNQVVVLKMSEVSLRFHVVNLVFILLITRTWPGEIEVKAVSSGIEGDIFVCEGNEWEIL